MQIQITLGDNDTPKQVADIVAALESVWGIERPMATLESTGDVFGSRTLHLPPVAEGESEALLAQLEAENPQFGKQPLPEGAGPLAPSAPSPAAAAPSTSAPAAPPGSSVDVDKNGLPWDERIHASSRAKIADGSWRMKRGVQQHVVETVETELRGQSSPLGDFVRSPDAERVVIGQAVAAAVDAAMPPGPPAPPAAPVAGAGLTFGQLAKRVGAKITLGELTAQDLGTQMAALGFPGGLHEASARPDMWATILETLGA